MHPATLPATGNEKGNETIRAHPIPSNLASYLDYYYACIEDLFLAYRDTHTRHTPLPLIIDTPGSMYDSNIKLLHKLLARIKPHHIIHLRDTRVINIEMTNLNSLQTVASQYRSTLHEITAQPPLRTPMRTETELRAMQMQSYFHLKPNTSNESEHQAFSWASEPLSHAIPWEFCYHETGDRTQDVVAFVTYNEPVEPASLIHTLNGTIIHIVEPTSSILSAPHTDLVRTPKTMIPYLTKSRHTGRVEALDPRTSKLICTAMIRGFDLERKVVLVSVPRTHDALLHQLSPKRTVFVSGCCDAPEWIYLEDTFNRARMKSCMNLKPEGEMEKGASWIEEKRTAKDMGYLNTARRVRKFQT